MASNAHSYTDRFFILSLDMLCVVGSDGFLKLTNPAFDKALGYTQEELLAQPLLSFIHPDDQNATGEAIQHLIAENPSALFENRIRLRDDTYRHFSWTASYTDDQVFHAVIRPIDEQSTLVESPFETLNNWLVDAPAGIIVLHGREALITLVNSLYEKVSGHTRAQLVGKKLIEVFPELYEQGIGEIFSRIFETGIAFRSEEFYAKFDHTGQGFLEEGYYDFVAQPVKDRSGQVTDIFIHLYEVTDYVRAREKLQESEEQFRALFNQSVIGNAEADLTGRFVLVNEQFCKMVGYSTDELLQLRMQDITHPDDLSRNAELFQRLIDEGTPFIIEKRYLHKNGSAVWVRNSVSPIRDANGNIKNAVAISFDVTEMRAAEQALREHQRDQAVAEERQRMARELHDSVTQTLFSAGLLTQSIPRLLQSQPEKALAQFDNLNTLIQGAASELRTMLWEMRPDRIVQTALGTLLVQLASAAQAYRPIKVSLHIHGDKEQTLPPDVLMVFYRIAQESVNNIVKHSEAAQMVMRLRRTDEYMMMTLADDGQGFDTLQNQSGFGLSIMRERASEIGAQIDVRSRVGVGTRIRVFWREPSGAEG